MSRKSPPDHPVEGLTRRERQVLDLIGEGLTSREAGHRLGVAPATVDSHAKAIVRKLEVGNRREAAVKAQGMRPPGLDEARRGPPVELLEADQLRALKLLADGGSVGDVARELGYSTRTVARRLADARGRLGVSTNIAAMLALEASWGRARPRGGPGPGAARLCRP